MPDILLSWVVLGAAAGVLVYLLSPRRLTGGFFTNLLAGVIGASTGGYLIGNATGADLATGTLTWGSVIVTGLAALIMLFIIQLQGNQRRQKSS